MPTSQNTSENSTKWYQNAGAALIFFTRLPLWRWYQPPRDAYKAVVEFWPLVGWITGGLMAATIYFGSRVMPYGLAILAAIALRILITGALHEDGLADFFDGFGGGAGNRERILSIMKDSHIGTYGVLAIIIYLATLFTCLYHLPPTLAALTIFTADPFSKMLAGQIVQMMPYARTENEAKAKVVYRKPSVRAGVLLAIQGLLPILICYLLPVSDKPAWGSIFFIPCIVMYFIYLKIWHSLRGYTGDCCGAIFLMVELSLYIAVCVMRGG